MKKMEKPLGWIGIYAIISLSLPPPPYDSRYNNFICDTLI